MTIPSLDTPIYSVVQNIYFLTNSMKYEASSGIQLLSHLCENFDNLFSKCCEKEIELCFNVCESYRIGKVEKDRPGILLLPSASVTYARMASTILISHSSSSSVQPIYVKFELNLSFRYLQTKQHKKINYYCLFYFNIKYL